jgi:hypothetical protein
MTAKEKITEDLNQVKEVGKLRSDRVREIIAGAIEVYPIV